jgi:hypothetical protein
MKDTRSMSSFTAGANEGQSGLVAAAPAGDTGVQEPLQVALPGGQELLLHSEGAGSIVRIHRAGQTSLKITVTATGLVLELGALQVSLEKDGALTVEADQLTLIGRKGVAVCSGEDLTLSAAGKLSSLADDQSIEARVGNVVINANDDVRVDAERILLNS